MINNMTSKDEKGNILVEGNFKVCNVADKCSGSVCSESCLINRMIHRLYKLEHPEETRKEEV